MNAKQEKIEALFDAAMKFGPGQRPAFLAAACGDDADLRQRLEILLQAEAQAGSFLPVKPLEAKTVLAPITEKAGDWIGRYKLLQQIGEGGCGVVYMAEQEEPVRRRVALKVIKLGMDTKSVIARFEAERQALAMMDHPNIAKVLDAGATDTGRPYFVMELVRGVRVTEYCDENNLPTRERLDLFIKVCQAIQHAHQKGVIHRDIKPSNILVTINDDVPVPKVIDFGIAKATEGRLTDKTLFTQFQSFIGTPAYMSPEQAVMTSLDIDTRSDIYALGVLLYELLTGRTPFDAKELLAAGFDEMRRTLREKEPVRPSTRLSTMAQAELTATAKHRSVEAPKLAPLLRGDLDWIVMKCLEKDRTRRYETANGLAADIKRHLNNEPVVARPPSAAYKFQKAWRRNKIAFAAGGAVFAALLVGVFVASWQAVRARKAEQAARLAERSERMQSEQARSDRDRALRAEAAAKNAESDTRDELENARAALAFIQDDLLGQASPDRQPDPHLTVRTLLDRASAQLAQATTRPPKVEAALRQTIGSVYFDLGEYALAIGHLERALDLQREQLGPAHEDTLRTFHILGETHWWNGDDAKSLELAREGWDLSRRELGETNVMTVHFLADVAAASVYTEPGTTEETERRIKDALRVISETLGDTNKLTFRMKVFLGMHHSHRGKFREAEHVLSQALERHRSVLPETDPLMLQAMAMLARVYANLTNLDMAEALNRRVLELRQSVLGPNHAMTVNIEIQLALIYLKRGEFSEADKIRTRLLELLAEGRLVETRLVVRSLVDLVRVYRLQQQWGKADEFAGAVLTAGRKQFKDEAGPLKVLEMDDEWAMSLMAQRRYAEAEPHCRRSVELREKHNNTQGRRFSAMSRLGYCLFKQNKDFDTAESLLKNGYEELDRRFKQLPDHRRLEIVGITLLRLADFYEGTGRPAEATVYKQKLTELEKAEGRRFLENDYRPLF